MDVTEPVANVGDLHRGPDGRYWLPARPDGDELEVACPACGMWTGSPDPGDGSGWEIEWHATCGVCGWGAVFVYEGEPGWL